MHGRMSAAKPGADKRSSATQSHEKNIKNAVTLQAESKVNRAGRYVFFKEEFKKIMKEHEKAHLLDRINSVIINHSVQEKDAHRFYLYWTDKSKHIHSYQVSYRTSAQFLPSYSKYLSEKNLPTLIPGLCNENFKEKQKYASLTVEEMVTKEITLASGDKKSVIEPSPLLLIWITLDGYYGEFHNTQIESTTSMTEWLRIYRYFSKLFAADNIFYVDDAMLASDNKLQIPLRLIAALAMGKNWHEQLLPRGMHLLECTAFAVTEKVKFNQDKSVHDHLLFELQNLKLTEWFNMLDGQQRKVLTRIFFLFFPGTYPDASLFRTGRNSHNENPFGEKTLRDLSYKIYKDLDTITLKVTTALELLHQLLCGTKAETFGLPEEALMGSDKWVKGRVHQLLRESSLWRYEPLPKSEEIAEQQYRHEGVWR